MIHFDDESSVAELEKRNRAQRSTNRKLRRAHKSEQEHSDELFVALCQSQLEAKAALGELWTRGGFRCGPEDYDQIVERCLEALGIVSFLVSNGSIPAA